MKIKLILPGFILGVLQFFTAPVMAMQYVPAIKYCSVVRQGPDLWRASFFYEVQLNAGGRDTTDNTFYIFVPQVDSNGKPSSGSAQVRASVNWTNVQYNTYLKLGGSSPTSLSFISSSRTTPKAITGNSWVSVDFNTNGNNAYPILQGWLENYTYLGGGASNPFWVSSAGCATGRAPPSTLPPIDELNPPEPEFKLNAAKWELNSVDVGDLPDIAAVGTGYAASIKNIANNNICVNYVTAGVKNKTYALGVTNTASMQGGRNLFTMQGPASQLFYNLQLSSNDGVTGNNFNFPTGAAKYINLSQAASSVAKRSQMCWTPKVNLFKNTQTKEGMHTDTLNFIITPKA